MKETGIQWIGAIPDSWNLIRLKDWCISKKEVAGQKSSEYERLALTLNGVIKRAKDDSEGLQPKEFDTYQILEANDFVFKMIDLQNISTSRVGLSPYTGLVSPAYIRFAPRHEGQFNEYIYYYLMSLYYNCVFNSMGGDGVRSALNATDMGNFKCPFPNIDLQKKIVSFIKEKSAEIDALIEVENKQIEKLKEYKQAVITEAVTKGLDKTAPMKDSGVDWIGEIPQDWKVFPLKYLFSFGKGLPITKENLIEEGIPVVSYGQIHAKWNTGVTLHNELKRFVSDTYLETNPECLVNKGDFIFADTSEDREGCGNAAFVDSQEVLFAGYHTIVLRANDKAYSKYLAYLFLTDNWRQQIRTRVSGVKLFSISKRILCDTSVLLPNNFEAIIDFLDDKCADIERLIEIKHKKIDELNEYKKSLIYEYVTGKKEVV